MIDGWSIFCEIVLTWAPQDLTDDNSTLVQVMAWCHQATSHYLNQCWPSSLASLGLNGWQTDMFLHIVSSAMLIWCRCFKSTVTMIGGARSPCINKQDIELECGSYNAVNFQPNPHIIHPIARQLGWAMGCNLWYDTDLHSARVYAVRYVIQLYWTALLRRD